jgi:hypothetical protein
MNDRAEQWDFDFRPKSYWVRSAENHVLSLIPGEVRREIARAALAAGGLDALTGTSATLTEEERRAWSGIHPAFMGGEFLPPIDQNQIEVARIALNSVTGDVISLRARRGRGDRIRYEFVDEYPEEERAYSFSPATSPRPLSFGEVVRLLEEATVSGTEPAYENLLTGGIELNLAEGADLLEMVRFVRVTSTYYPQLEAYFEARFEAWGAQKQRAIDEEEKAEEAQAAERERRLAPLREQINAEMGRIAAAWPPATSANGAIARAMGLAKRRASLEDHVLENGTLPPRNEGG